MSYDSRLCAGHSFPFAWHVRRSKPFLLISPDGWCSQVAEVCGHGMFNILNQAFLILLSETLE